MYVLKSQRFSIIDVSFEGFETEDPTPAEIITRRYIDEPVLGVFLRGNRFLFDIDQATKLTEEAVHASVTGVRREGSRIIITVLEADPAFLWTMESGVYVGRTDGTIERALTEEERSNLFGPSVLTLQTEEVIEPVNEAGDSNNTEGETINNAPEIDPVVARKEKALTKLRSALMIRDLSNAPIEIEGRAMRKEAFANLVTFHDLLKGASLEIGTVELDPSLGDWASIMISTPKGSHKLIFSLFEDAKRQFANYLSVTQNEKLSEGIRQYVDVRFKDHVYFK